MEPTGIVLEQKKPEPLAVWGRTPPSWRSGKQTRGPGASPMVCICQDSWNRVLTCVSFTARKLYLHLKIIHWRLFRTHTQRKNPCYNTEWKKVKINVLSKKVLITESYIFLETKIKENNVPWNITGGYVWRVNVDFSWRVISVPQYFMMQIFKHTAKLKEFHSKYAYTRHLDCTTKFYGIWFLTYLSLYPSSSHLVFFNALWSKVQTPQYFIMHIINPRSIIAHSFPLKSDPHAQILSAHLPKPR